MSDGRQLRGKRSAYVVDDRTPQQDILFWQVEEEETQVTLTPVCSRFSSRKISIAPAAIH
jgi:hypothetical protein